MRGYIDEVLMVTLVLTIPYYVYMTLHRGVVIAIEPLLFIPFTAIHPFYQRLSSMPYDNFCRGCTFSSEISGKIKSEGATVLLFSLFYSLFFR